MAPKIALTTWLRTLPWLVLLAVAVGSAVALFLWGLGAVTQLRLAHPQLVWGLPVVGLGIGWLYWRYGRTVGSGHHLLLTAYQQPNHSRTPLRLAPLVLLGTWLTHLVGGSAGREGTAVQMGGAFAERLWPYTSGGPTERRWLLLAGISGGFAAVFGTPWAGAVFALEVVRDRKLGVPALATCLLSAWGAHVVCMAWGTGHDAYPLLPAISTAQLLWLIPVGVTCGLTATAYLLCHRWLRTAMHRLAPPLWQPLWGGLLLLAIYLLFPTTQASQGLGVPHILAAFHSPQPASWFLLKLVLTALTLAVGFKGGEVTPLFFMGALLGNALAGLGIPVPLPVLAGACFVGVFAGATKAPLACVLMGLALFGAAAVPACAVACLLAHWSTPLPGLWPKPPVK
jgi:H+/Cl- antiporter ClcA